MKPQHFYKVFPIASILQNYESELVASNIMTILYRIGNKWRKLSYTEYKTERLKDGNYSDQEHKYFLNVINFCVSLKTAKAFCKKWCLIAEKK